MNLPKISALDLRPLQVQVDEYNRLNPFGLKKAVWDQKYFERSHHVRLSVR